MKKIEKLLTDLEKKISNFEAKNQSISSETVGWHVQHSLLVLQQIIIALENSTPETYKWKFNFWRLLIMGRNKIPRGKAKAPSRVLPKETITKELLENSLKETKSMITVLTKLKTNHYFTHPFFGDLNLKPSISFLALHTEHHLDIIKDILKK